MKAVKVGFKILWEVSVSKILVKIVQILGKLTRRNFEYLRPISENWFGVNPKFDNTISDSLQFKIILTILSLTEGHASGLANEHAKIPLKTFSNRLKSIKMRSKQYDHFYQWSLINVFGFIWKFWLMLFSWYLWWIFNTNETTLKINRISR